MDEMRHGFHHGLTLAKARRAVESTALKIKRATASVASATVSLQDSRERLDRSRRALEQSRQASQAWERSSPWEDPA